MATAQRLETLPYGPRRCFIPYHQRTQRWACLVVHRRGGKTVACVNDAIARALNCPKPFGRYAYVAPFLSQAKEVAWEYLKRYAWPATAKVNESELWIELVNGARVRVHGGDNPDRLRGSYLDGVVLDEYADMRPQVWGEVIRPMLADRQGWATFIGTPKGRNEFFEKYEEARYSEEWYSLLLRGSDNVNADPLLKAELAAMRHDLTAEQYEQEVECSFEAAILGAYFGKEMVEAERQGRITEVPYDPNAKVYTAWDLGKGANMAVWVWQAVGSEIHVIDFIEGAHSDGIPQIDRVLRSKEYPVHADWVPHDAKATEIGSGRTRIETLVGLQRKPQLVWDHNVEDGINAARIEFKRCWFDRDKCKDGLESLRQYRAEFDDKLKTFKDAPRKDWATHAADAFRYLCMAYRQPAKPVEPKKPEPLRGVENITVNELIKITQPKRERV